MWIEHKDHIAATFQFIDFTDAMSFMMEVAFACEKMNHHPEWTNVWNRVNIKLNTHDAGNIVTSKDWELAKEIEKIYERRKH